MKLEKKMKKDEKKNNKKRRKKECKTETEGRDVVWWCYTSKLVGGGSAA